ncbi:hypothetical protein HN937_05260 [Candidatus Poribacteria bacterium]|nr:hypothetical protein [Candidatus Poribacteria bacterium]
MEPTPERASNVVTVMEETAVYSEPQDWGYVMAVIPPGSEVAVTGRTEGSWWAVEDFGWVQGEPGSVFAAVDVPEVPTWAVVGLFHPSDVRTGVEFVDVVIAALVAEDRAALAELLVFAETECVEEPEMGSPPRCPEGVAEGSQVEMFEYASVGPNFVTAADRGRVLEELFATTGDASGGPAVYAVIEGRSASDFDLMWSIPGAPYEIVLGLGDGQIHQVKVSEQGIEWLGIALWSTPPAWTIYPMGDEPVPYLLAPVVPAPMVAAQ